jgi:hypothetical protein
MQISVKTPPQLSLPLLEKCAAYGTDSPSHFLQDCVWQCVQWMDTPHRPFHPLPMVEKYYRALGREDELLPRPRKKQDAIIQRLAEEDRVRRAKEAAKRLADLHAQLKKQPPSKHLHLKISQGMADLPQRIKAKAEWLRVAPNALVMACLRDCLEAMNDPKKALMPPPIVVDFWTTSHAKLRPKAANSVESMVLESYEKMLRERSGPILDTIVRLALSEQWDTSLKQILNDADVLPKGHLSKNGIRGG